MRRLLTVCALLLTACTSPTAPSGVPAGWPMITTAQGVYPLCPTDRACAFGPDVFCFNGTDGYRRCK